MGDSVTKATYINLFLLAAADGEIDPAERAYLKRFEEVAGISRIQAKRWRSEVDGGLIHFRPIDDSEKAREALGIMARMLRVDGEFGAEEQSAYVAMGKALGFDHEALGVALRAFWDKDPLVPAPEAPTPGTASLLIVEDDFGDRGPLEISTGSLALDYVTMGDISRIAGRPKVVVFHAAEQRTDSQARLETLQAAFPAVFLGFVARRDQAAQIGHLLERGANRCFVAPLYPGELAQALGKILG